MTDCPPNNIFSGSVSYFSQYNHFCDLPYYLKIFAETLNSVTTQVSRTDIFKHRAQLVLTIVKKLLFLVLTEDFNGIFVGPYFFYYGNMVTADNK